MTSLSRCGKWLGAALAVALLVPVPARAQLLSGFEHFSRGNYCKARQLWLEDWKSDDSSAALGLAEIYARGLCGKEDQRRASLWYLRAAQSGSARARSELGVRYAYGKGVEQNYFKSYVWLGAAKVSASPWERTLLDAVQQNSAMIRPRLSAAQRSSAERILADFAGTHVLPAEFADLD